MLQCGARIVLSKGVKGMAFFQDLGKQLSEAAQVVGKRTSEAAEIGRLNGKLSGIRGQIDQLYMQIGKAYYATRESRDEHEAASRMCEQVDELTKQMETIRGMIDRIKQQRRCPNCGGIQPSGSSFCASCGTRLPEEEPAIVPETVTAEPAEPDEDLSHATCGVGDVNVEINWPKPAPDDADEDEDEDDDEDEEEDEEESDA